MSALELYIEKTPEKVHRKPVRRLDEMKLLDSLKELPSMGHKNYAQENFNDIQVLILADIEDFCQNP